MGQSRIVSERHLSAVVIEQRFDVCSVDLDTLPLGIASLQAETQLPDVSFSAIAQYLT